jgi:hypothetical protein
MSIKEADAIKEFVSSGGLVIGFNEPATYSEHGRLLEMPRLKELFPITNKNHLLRYGKGHALYLTKALNGYHARLTKGDFSGSDPVAEALKKYAGMEPPAEITFDNGLPARDILAPMFCNGNAAYLGLMRYDRAGIPQKENVHLDLSKKYYVWESRTGTYVGAGKQLDIELDMLPKFYALLPAKPVSLHLESAEDVKQGNSLDVTGKFTFEGPTTPFNQVINIKVFFDGRELEYYRRNVSFENGIFHTKIPVSHSEKYGVYTLVARDAATGISAKKTFEVK